MSPSDPYAALYLQHRQGLYTLAMAITACPGRAEDAVHEAFLRLWRGGPPSGDPVAYVYRAVRNAAIDQRRRQARRLPLSECLFAAGPAPAEGLERSERAEALRQALAGLPEEQREAIVLRAYAGLSFAQIAEALDQPLPTIASRYRRGLARLREVLAGVDPGKECHHG